MTTITWAPKITSESMCTYGHRNPPLCSYDKREELLTWAKMKSPFPNFLCPRGTQWAINQLSRGSGSPARADRLILALILAFLPHFDDIYKMLSFHFGLTYKANILWDDRTGPKPTFLFCENFVGHHQVARWRLFTFYVFGLFEGLWSVIFNFFWLHSNPWTKFYKISRL